MTVCHLCFNNARVICEAITAVRNTNYPNIEHIVIDDASRPEEVEILRKHLIELDVLNIELIVHDKNRGIPASQNHAISLANGKYFIGSISDDIMTPNRISGDVLCLEESDQRVVGLFAIAETFHAKIGDGNGYFHGDLKGFKAGKSYELMAEQLRELLQNNNFIPAPTVLLKTDWLQSVQFDTTYFLEDYPLWVKIVKNDKSLMYRTEMTTYYRRLEYSFSNRGPTDFFAIRIEQDRIRCRLDLLPEPHDQKEVVELLRNTVDILRSGFPRQKLWVLATIHRKRISGILFLVACCTDKRYPLRIAWFLSRFLAFFGVNRV